jgi:hypothetical protein
VGELPGHLTPDAARGAEHKDCLLVVLHVFSPSRLRWLILGDLTLKENTKP